MPNEIEIRPTVKFVLAGAITIGLVALIAWVSYLVGALTNPWAPLVPTVLLLWPLERWMRLRNTVSVLSGDRLRSQSGLLARSTHTLQLSKVQDVGVYQSFLHRIFGIGDVWIETSGAASRIMLRNVDAPQAIADMILNSSQQQSR